MLLMTIFQQLGPALPMKIPPNDNNDDLSYFNNIIVNHNKFSFSSTRSSTVFSHLNNLDLKQQVLIISLLK